MRSWGQAVVTDSHVSRPPSPRARQLVFVLAFVTSVLLCVLVSAQAPLFDLIVRGGTIVDGSGLPRYRADVAVANGFIARIGDLSNARAAEEIDATGLFVAPGFINIHSHASVDALPTAENMLTQGVTTEILNPDGGGSVDLPQQLARASAAGLALNIGGYIGFNSAWTQVMGPADRRASREAVSYTHLTLPTILRV